MASPSKFLKEVKEELSRVVWPTKNETLRLTLIIIGISLTVGIYLSILDVTLSRLVDRLIAR